MQFLTLDDLDVAGKRVLVRDDLNVPVKDGKVTDATRIQRQAPTLRELSGKGARVIVLSHFDRPKGKVVPEMSLRPIVGPLSEALGRKVVFGEDCIGAKARLAIDALRPGDVALLENTRFHAGEEKNDPKFAREIASLGDIYVNDAFSAAHRAHATTEAIAHLLLAAAGRSMQAELEHLSRALDKPKRPLMAVVGGAKISTKIALLESLVQKVDVLVIGGAMANTFLAAQGHPIGKSLAEADQAEVAQRIMTAVLAAGAALLLPEDVVTASELKVGSAHRVAVVTDVRADEMILDVGPKTIDGFRRRLEQASTLVWNGPFGAFEFPPFDVGTVAAARTVAERTASGRLLSVAGGGDTVAALVHAGAIDGFTYVSTAGGAFLEWLEGRTLPGVAALEEAAKKGRKQ